MKHKILYNLHIINNLQIDIDCKSVVKQILFNMNVAVAFPPPIEIVKEVGLFTCFTYNNIMFKYIYRFYT